MDNSFKNFYYQYIDVLKYESGCYVSCELIEPIPCTESYFIHAFWMPMKHQIGEKVAFVALKKNKRMFSLFYNRLAVEEELKKSNKQFTEAELMEYCKEDSEIAFATALDHIDNIFAHFYPEKAISFFKTVPFITEAKAIRSINEHSIHMFGRLPMQEEYFIEKYWKPIIKPYHKAHKGVRFKLAFSEENTVITVSAEFCQQNAIRAKKGLPRINGNEAGEAIINEIISDIADAIIDVAKNYSKTCEEAKEEAERLARRK